MADTQVKKKSWWRRPWIMPLRMLVVVFVAFSLPPYLSMDPAQSRVPQPGDHTWHFPALAAHVVFGSIAILTAVLQMWPWFRRRHPVWHRYAGRVYVFAGVLPAGALAVPVAAVSPFGISNQVSGVMMGVLWVVFTVVGLRMARQRRYADHRRWMLRSAVLTLSIIGNRIWGVVFTIVLTPQLDTTFGGNQAALTQAVASVTSWVSWAVPLLVLQWWLERNRRPARRQPARPAERVEVSV
ncbi:DUF2306 domain-containing protein [Saccharothrix obliqua]|uniref:DUF2306 domain-containing protein n=1 Tax=Saccharothrix obliqua TaxID=2861747 RepID=UPI001C5CDE5C|nr:DUF2306 domain-containing protein [Saccharothrix obliqua]MBW4719055.1 DUF2306 domain-containing protein [Saccharothrix obliqua]